ncbi:glutamate/aspartate import solute-binding protein [Rhodoferax lithotrophicus]|uniref:Glutamate/aspartate import solute-binding protein n=2 Tax=Rhodoferax lithotrophicus TaxID=2798804 RepID=A0ABM7MQ44_9BURK|nr:glutamate/aspartate import solute-binding protein [Rhodoferax sp. MIZ03]
MRGILMIKMSRCFLWCCLGVSSQVAMAQAQTPVLKKIAAGGHLVLAHRESSIPFSYLNGDKKPVGYALDLCLKIAEAVRKKTSMPNMVVDYLQVTPANRIDMVAQGTADLECGSTTNNAERRQKVAFTIPHFITGARLLVRSDSPITLLEGLEGKRLVSTKGTTPLKAAIQANRERMLRIQILEASDHEKAVEMVEKGEADAFVMDDVLLYGLAASRPNPAGLKVVGKFLTTEPLAIMLPKGDPDFKALVDEEMRHLIYSGEARTIYNKWFMQPIPPKNTSLSMPMSYLLKDFWKYPSDQVPL